MAREIIGELAQREDGLVEGWCHAHSRPLDRLEVDLFIDETLIASLTAASDRPDLRAAGFGDGMYGFALRLPVSIDATPTMLVARECATGTVFARLRLGTARISGNDPDPARLNDLLVQVEEVWERLNTPRTTAAAEPARELAQGIALVGANLRGEAAGQAGIVPVLRDTMAPLARGLRLPVFEVPACSLLLPAGADAAACAAAIASLAPWLEAIEAELIVVDRAGDDARVALLPSLIPGLAYARSGARSTAGAGNDVALAAGGTTLVFLAAPQPGADYRGIAELAHCLRFLARGAADSLAGASCAGAIARLRPELAATAPICDIPAPACLRLAIGRDAFASIGGFDAAMDEASQGDSAVTLLDADLLLRTAMLGRMPALLSTGASAMPAASAAPTRENASRFAQRWRPAA